MLEKGTMDALLRGGDDGWHRMCLEVARVLRPGGDFLQVGVRRDVLRTGDARGLEGRRKGATNARKRAV